MWAAQHCSTLFSTTLQTHTCNGFYEGRITRKNLVHLPKNLEKNVIERLSKRYGLSEDFQSEILPIIDDPAQTGDFSFGHEDEKYCINVKMRETDFDIHLHFCQIIEDID